MSKCRTDEEMRIFLQSKSERIPEAGCWIWLGGLDKDGYGQTHYQGKNIRAHRVSHHLFNGSVDAELAVMHRCDVPTCINPAHLRLGTNEENNADKMKKNRHRVASGDDHYMRRNPVLRSGERGAAARLTEADVRAILRLSSTGTPQKELARQFGVTRTGISAIVTRRTWKHLAV